MDSWSISCLGSCDESFSNHQIESINDNQMFGFSPFFQENDSNCGIDTKVGSRTCDPSGSLKRPREAGLRSLTPVCQVVGCNKNLTNCKEYHKRHKVCEIHTKTSKVIVNGIQQRFCQQCSRFHLLREFDDAKRSCRKRLAGHNERRRKPFPKRHENFIPTHNVSLEGNEFKRSAGAISSLKLPYDRRIPYQIKNETDRSLQTNLEDRPPHNLQSISCVTDEKLHSKSLSPYNFETNPRFVASSSESAHSLLSYQSQHNSSSIIQTSRHTMPFNYEPNQDSVQLHQNDLNPVLGVEGTIDLLQLSSHLEIVERKKSETRK